MAGMEIPRTSGGAIAVKRFLSNDHIAIGARVFIGMLFIVASADKISSPDPFATSIANYKILPGGMELSVATVLPWVELLSGLGILVGVFFRGSALIASALSAVFLIAVASALFRGLDISCGCFSQDPSVGRINWEKLVENGILTALSFYLFFSTSNKFKLEFSLRQEPSEKTV